MRLQTKRVAVATIFGAVIFVTKIIMPSPIDKMFIFPQSLLLALSALMLRRVGATYVAVIGGILTALWRSALAPFSFVFAVVYGLLVDSFFFILNVNVAGERVKTSRLIASMTVSTALVGFLSSNLTVFFGLPQIGFSLQAVIFIAGTLNGSVAGYVTSVLWNKRLKTLTFN